MGRANQEVSAAFNQQVLESIMQKDPDNMPLLVTTAEAIGKALAQNEPKLSTAQIRNIFSTARRIQANWSTSEQQSDKLIREVMLLQPKLAYQSVREPGVKLLAEWLIPAINMVYGGTGQEGERRERFQHFMEFFEAILAYHTAHGGKQEKKDSK